MHTFLKRLLLLCSMVDVSYGHIVSAPFLDAIVACDKLIPEFETRHSLADYQLRLQNQVGFKFAIVFPSVDMPHGYVCAYQASLDGTFQRLDSKNMYIFSAGVIPEFRGLNLMKQLLGSLQMIKVYDKKISTVSLHLPTRFSPMMHIANKLGYQQKSRSGSGLDEKYLLVKEL